MFYSVQYLVADYLSEVTMSLLVMARYDFSFFYRINLIYMYMQVDGMPDSNPGL